MNELDNDMIIEGPEFECKCCGECCRRDPYYAVSLLDIQNISSWLDMDPVEFFNEYCDVVTTPGGFRYSAILAPEGCPFLKDKLCSIHFVKPIGCWVFPESSFLSLSEIKRHINAIKACGLLDLPEGEGVLKTDLEIMAARDIHFEETKKYFEEHDRFDEASWRVSAESLRKKLLDAEELERRSRELRKRADKAIKKSAKIE
jgi:Fe-S-cluster containining protein